MDLLLFYRLCAQSFLAIYYVRSIYVAAVEHLFDSNTIRWWGRFWLELILVRRNYSTTGVHE